MKKALLLIAPATLAVLLFTGCKTEKEPELHTINIQSYEDLREFFRYRPDRPTTIRAHRGGREIGYPENCIESFENILRHIPAYFEIDPHLTKDSVLVLMHDATIDRTTNGSGKVRDYTYEELQQFNLVDREGNVTEFKIPTLAEAIEWGRGKTIFNIDRKDAPYEMVSQMLIDMKAYHALPATRDPEHARFYLDRNPEMNVNIWLRSLEEFEAFDASGLPWSQIVTFSGFEDIAQKYELYDKLHEKGISYAISLSQSVDKLPDGPERDSLYVKMINTRPDIIETDFPLHVYRLLQEQKK